MVLFRVRYYEHFDTCSYMVVRHFDNIKEATEFANSKNTTVSKILVKIV